MDPAAASDLRSMDATVDAAVAADLRSVDLRTPDLAVAADSGAMSDVPASPDVLMLPDFAPLPDGHNEPGLVKAMSLGQAFSCVLLTTGTCAVLTTGNLRC